MQYNGARYSISFYSCRLAPSVQLHHTTLEAACCILVAAGTSAQEGSPKTANLLERQKHSSLGLAQRAWRVLE